MNLRFTPSILALALSISASARSVSEANPGIKVAVHSTPFQEDATEKFKARRRAERSISTSMFDQGSADGRRFYYPDVGILQEKTHRRQFGGATMYGEVQHGNHAVHAQRVLQAEEAPLCGTNGTCAPSFCDAMGSRFSLYAAAVELHAICNGYIDSNGKNWTFEGCFRGYPGFPGVQEYQKNGYCQLAQCFVDGGSPGSCYCQLYQHACKAYGNDRPYDSYSIGFCEIDACCQNNTDEAGMKSCLSGYTPSRNKYRQENPRCGTNGTCEPSICDCYVNSDRVECAASFNDLCNGVTDANGKNWGFEGCYRDYPDYPDFQMYHNTLYCDTAKCIVDGGTFGSCYCQVHQTLCEEFGNVGKYNYIPDAAGVCEVSTCCQGTSTEAGKMACFWLTNSSATVSSTSNPPVQNSSASGEVGTLDETSPNNGPSSSALSTSSVGAMSSLVTAAAVLSMLGSDAIH